MWKTLAKTSLAVAATATLGSLATRPDDPWYQNLTKPSWQPPPAAFPLVWTPIYLTIAYASARAINRAPAASRPTLTRSLAVNLTLNAAWTPLFFLLQSPKAALIDITLLNLSNAHLIYHSHKSDPPSALLLLPYATWTTFATALTTSITLNN
ncbi:TspO/MBR family protein [Actinocorallia sp. A-T 12471]|uniref:TspO/MBR family protein n=1 Tax=Actinocorallia sp. A-T 12471 TaxID=3089813 RepID=UPI0029D01005|nr:TspO/MBR family protein [Actinocorallia sp. A-T 12471]MDX6740349.1 TspO/MBR family protein [Actinocorallia sp. A-T 12471]